MSEGMKVADPTQNKQIIADAYDALARGDVRGFLGILDPEIDVREPTGLPYGGAYRGLDELMGMFAKAGPVLDSSRLVVEELTADEDRVVALLVIPLRNGGADALISEHWRMRDGKAVSLQVFWFDPALAPAAV
jgi:ketosteroid isomerase-like protein